MTPMHKHTQELFGVLTLRTEAKAIVTKSLRLTWEFQQQSLHAHTLFWEASHKQKTLPKLYTKCEMQMR